MPRRQPLRGSAAIFVIGHYAATPLFSICWLRVMPLMRFADATIAIAAARSRPPPCRPPDYIFTISLCRLIFFFATIRHRRDGYHHQ